MKRSALSPVKFLLVDDREDNLLTLEAILQRDELEILTARSGDQALELLLEHDVALALLDVQMPEMDGFQLAELMRGTERTRHVPIIFLTAGLREPHRVFRGYESGAVDFLFKPIEPAILCQKADTFFQLYRQRQELEETLRLNEMFMAAVGHDLRNPLNAILMAADLLERTYEGPQANTVERVRTSGRRMARMIDDLFDLARARLAGGIPVHAADADLAEVARRAIHEHETAAGCPIHLEVAGDARACVDAARVEQLIGNLLGNAIRHGRQGARVTVRVTGDVADVSISIHNEGAVAPEVRRNLFDPFRSREERRARADGLGLGLYIVQQIVHAHHGRISVESSEEAGTTFIVSLPRTARA